MHDEEIPCINAVHQFKSDSSCCQCCLNLSSLHCDWCTLKLVTWYALILGEFEFIVRALKQSERVFYRRDSLFVAPYWRATKMGKPLSTATSPLWFWFFLSCWCLAKLIFTYSSAISFSEFKVSTQCIFRISCDRDDRRIFLGLIFSISGFWSPAVRYVRMLVEFWNPELWNLESSSRNPECREQLESRILVHLTRNPKSRIHGVESRIHDHLGLHYVGLSY